MTTHLVRLRLSAITFILSTSMALALNAQGVDSLQLMKEYTRLEEALQEPQRVYRLNLSRQLFDAEQVDFSVFTNLEYLNLRGDSLQSIPRSILKLERLKVLDLSENPFELLPDQFIELRSLEELYLNDEPRLDMERSLEVLSQLPRLKSLHIEHDRLEQLPPNITKLQRLERLYLNDNLLRSIPSSLQRLKRLKYLEMRNNPLPDNFIPSASLKVQVKL